MPRTPGPRPCPPGSIALVTLAALLGSGCGDRADEGEGAGEEELPACSPLRVETSTAESDDDGRILLEIPLEAGDQGFQITLDDPDLDVYSAVDLVVDPDNDEVFTYDAWAGGTEILSGGVLPVAYSTAFDWPIRDIDGELRAGTWRVGVQVISDLTHSPQQGADIEVTVHTKGPGQLEQGCLDLRVLLADGIEEDTHVADSVDRALEQMVDLYAAQGITITHTVDSVDLDAVLPSPGEGDLDYLALSGEGPEEQVVMIIGDYLENSDQGVLGESGGAPGSLAPTERSVVAISWLMQAGGSGKFDDEEVAWLSETMSHELGHYLGLHHPVTFDSDYEAAAWDALDDTETCGDFDDCFDILGENLMFPYSLCAFTQDCEHQDQVTDDQRGVLVRYTGTL